MGKRPRSLSSLCCANRRGARMSVGGSPSPGGQRRQQGASLIHALVVLFLEFFSWGLLTVPVINVLADTFPANKFLMNGLILGLKGILSFLSSPLIGALSDVYGRKPFLLLTVFFTCMPIPCLKISPWWYFTLFTLSGLFSVTFSVVLAYVADITDRDERTTACGLVSATFAASLVTSPALGAYLSRAHSDDAVVLLASLIVGLDLLFILLFVPESLKGAKPGDGDLSSSAAADALLFDRRWQSSAALDPLFIWRFLRDEATILRLSAIVFLSYLPEAGQFSCFFVYLRLVVGFSPEAVALFIAFVGVLSVLSQTVILLLVTKRAGPKSAITLGLFFQFVQLLWYGLGQAHWMMWAAGLFAALSQMTYPAISAFISLQSDKELQGTVQGILSGIRGLCQGMGPAVFGLVFYVFGMDLSSDTESAGHIGVGPQFPVPNIRLQPFYRERIIGPARHNNTGGGGSLEQQQQGASGGGAGALVGTSLMDSPGIVPGPPFLCGALLVFLAILLNWSLPSRKKIILLHRRSSSGSGGGGGGGSSSARHGHLDTATALLIDGHAEKSLDE